MKLIHTVSKTQSFCWSDYVVGIVTVAIYSVNTQLMETVLYKSLLRALPTEWPPAI